MRKPLLAAVAAAAVLVPAGPATAASFHGCPGGFNPDGSAGEFYGSITVKRTTCRAARNVTRSWVLRHADGSRNPTARMTVLGYSCRGRATSSAGDPNGGLRVLCVDGRRAVAFTGHP